MPTIYGLRLAALAEQEFDDLHAYSETTPRMQARIHTYWTSIGLPFPGVATPWSAVFVSFMVQTAGTTAAEFTFAPSHSVFVYQAIRNATAGTGVFHGHPPTSQAPDIGDIIQNNRAGSYDYAHAAANRHYKSHSAIVVEKGSDGQGQYVRTIGGNESDRVGERIVRLQNNGLIAQPASDPDYYICVIETLKP